MRKQDPKRHLARKCCSMRTIYGKTELGGVWTEIRRASRRITAIRSPISTEIKITPKNAPMQAMKSNLSIFHMRIAASKSIRPITAHIIIDERIALGVYLKRGVMNSKVKKTTHDITMFDTAVLQPAM